VLLLSVLDSPPAGMPHSAKRAQWQDLAGVYEIDVFPRTKAPHAKVLAALAHHSPVNQETSVSITLALI
jgi:hypothetical protein